MVTATENIVELNEKVEESFDANLEVKVKKEVLTGVLRRIDRARERNTVRPITGGIYLHFSEDKITARAMNSDYSTEIIVNNEDKDFEIVSGEAGGAVFMDARFTSMINSLPRKNIVMEIKGNKAQVKAGRSSFDLQILNASEFPHFMEEREGVRMSIHPEVLSRLYEKTIHACSTSETRPVLTGIRHYFNGENLTLSSTDSHRLSQVTQILDESITEEEEGVEKVVPGVSIQEVQRQLKNAKSDVVVYLSDSSAIYELDDGTTIFARVLESKYPDIARIIPTDFQTIVRMKAEDLKGMVQRAALVDDKSPAYLFVKAEAKQLRLISEEAEGPGAGFMEDLTLLEGTGPDLKLGFNVRYFQDALAHHSPETLLDIKFLDQMKPFIVQAEQANDKDLDLILPIRVPGSALDGSVEIEDFRGDTQLEIEEE